MLARFARSVSKVTPSKKNPRSANGAVRNPYSRKDVLDGLLGAGVPRKAIVSGTSSGEFSAAIS